MTRSHPAQAIRVGGKVLVDILEAMNDQDSNRSPAGNACRLALHRHGQDSQAASRCRAMGWRGSPLVLPNSAGFGYRPTGLNPQPSTDGRKGFLAALDDRVCTLVTHGGCAAIPKDENNN
jgi:hypothetical protein